MVRKRSINRDLAEQASPRYADPALTRPAVVPLKMVPVRERASHARSHNARETDAVISCLGRRRRHRMPQSPNPLSRPKKEQEAEERRLRRSMAVIGRENRMSAAAAVVQNLGRPSTTFTMSKQPISTNLRFRRKRASLPIVVPPWSCSNIADNAAIFGSRSPPPALGTIIAFLILTWRHTETWRR